MLGLVICFCGFVLFEILTHLLQFLFIVLVVGGFFFSIWGIGWLGMQVIYFFKGEEHSDV